MNITKLTLNNSRMTFVLMALIISLGLMVYTDFPSREDPLVRINKAMIIVKFPGLPPEQVENLITKKVEEKLREIPGIEFINSVSKTGQAVITVSAFEHIEDYIKVWDKVRRKLDETKQVLPQGAIGPIFNDDYGDVSIFTAALTGQNWSMAQLRAHARKIRDRLYTINGIRRVTLHGLQQEKVYVEGVSSVVESNSIDFINLVGSIKDQNLIIPAGKVLTDVREITVETSGKLQSKKDLDELEIRSTNGGTVPLKDYLSLRSSYGEPSTELAYFNGKPAVVIAASMQMGRNILELGPQLKLLLKQVNLELPVGMQLQIATFQADVVEHSIDSVKESLYQTLLIVLAIVILSLGVTEGLIVGITVPLTILASLLVMFFLEIDLQFISLASLIIALGMLVDNAIVITENIHLRLHAGENRRKAALNACQELAWPLLTSTLTTVLAFSPILLAQTTAGEYTRSLAQVVSISLLISWLLSLTVVPLLAVHFIRKKQLHAPFILIPIYQKFVTWVVNFPKRFLLAITATFMFSVYILSLVPVEMFAVSSRSEVLVYVDLPAGYNVRQTEQATSKLTDWLLDSEHNPDVNYVSSYIGTGGPRFFLSIIPNSPAPNNAFMIVNTQSADSASNMLAKIRNYAAKNLAHINIRTELISRGTVPPGVVQLRFTGPDADQLFALSKQAEAALADIPGALHVRNSWENKTSRYRINIDQAKVRRSGITYQAISQSLQATFSGVEITTIRRDDTLIPVIMKVKSTSREMAKSSNPLDLVKVYLNTGEPQYVLLSQVATIESVSQFGSIVRRNMQKTITVEGKHSRWKAPELQAAWDNKIKDIYENLPSGYSIELGGELEGFKNSAGTLFVTLPLFIGLILCLIVSQFNSFRKTLIVACTIPLAFSGGFIGLYLTGANFDFIGALGFISLAGIIINNAIVLIDKISAEQVRGKTKLDAILSASTNRLRPILITTVTTVLALIPLMMMSESLFYSMASVIIFGMSLGTIMTLGAVPALYMILIKGSKTSANQLKENR
ncbi:efflux RND transporter permease subunit [Thalassotalea fonticola]|uniref:Efflux RND transporter permease subunit n=1 Tax=Thalassotalea fonticola TaxID=3065649 RepID=A0ABZ0GKP9_9GAMM|nr:efflux RND transporter permease subunit [Colwelliaceae bacterium S1-1]